MTIALGDILFKHRNHQAINSSMMSLRIGCWHHHQRTSIPARHCRNSIKFPTPRSICPKTLEKYTRHLRKLRERRKKQRSRSLNFAGNVTVSIEMNIAEPGSWDAIGIVGHVEGIWVLRGMTVRILNMSRARGHGHRWPVSERQQTHRQRSQ